MRDLVVLCLFIVSALGISFDLAPESKRCIKEEAHKDALVVGDFEIQGIGEGYTVEILVSDTKDQILFTKEAADTGKFAFSLDDYDMFSICFTGKKKQDGKRYPPPPGDLQVKIDIKRGIEAKSYSDFAKVAQLKPMELELKKLEDLAEAIVSDFAYMKSREKLMRDTNKSTNSRVLWFSIFSMVVLLGLALWQVFYLKRFFKAKKLIE